MLRKGGNKIKQIRRLSSYAFVKSWLIDGVYISSNEKAVALCYRYDIKIFSIIEVLYELVFAVTSINLKHLPKVLKRESYRKSIRPSSGRYLYFWFFGALKDAGGAARELKNSIFEYSYKQNLSIYLETAVERNKQVYERFGFVTYHYWEDKAQNIQFWFMKREPVKP